MTTLEGQPVYCQSCSMPLTNEELFGTERSGAKSDDYCLYCYEDGAFKQPDLTVGDMIAICLPHMADSGWDTAEARAALERQLPGLKRWAAGRRRLQPVRFEDKEAFVVAGLAVTTSNADEFSGQGKIAGLWQQLYTGGILESLNPLRADENIYGCYANYENGDAGQYDIIAGARVTKAIEREQISDVTSVTLPAAKYAVFTTERGGMDTVVIQAWEDIWHWSQASGFERSFTGDFECYDERASDYENAQVDIYIAIK